MANPPSAPTGRIVLFGATGYTGDLTARTLVAAGVRPVLAVAVAAAREHRPDAGSGERPRCQVARVPGRAEQHDPPAWLTAAGARSPPRGRGDRRTLNGALRAGP